MKEFEYTPNIERVFISDTRTPAIETVSVYMNKRSLPAQMVNNKVNKCAHISILHVRP